jgi:hypothetical protein
MAQVKVIRSKSAMLTFASRIQCILHIAAGFPFASKWALANPAWDPFASLAQIFTDYSGDMG